MEHIVDLRGARYMQRLREQRQFLYQGWCPKSEPEIFPTDVCRSRQAIPACTGNSDPSDYPYFDICRLNQTMMLSVLSVPRRNTAPCKQPLLTTPNSKLSGDQARSPKLARSSRKWRPSLRRKTGRRGPTFETLSHDDTIGIYAVV